jgi:hypothetical protein
MRPSGAVQLYIDGPPQHLQQQSIAKQVSSELKPQPKAAGHSQKIPPIAQHVAPTTLMVWISKSLDMVSILLRERGVEQCEITKE